MSVKGSLELRHYLGPSGAGIESHGTPNSLRLVAATLLKSTERGPRLGIVELMREYFTAAHCLAGSRAIAATVECCPQRCSPAQCHAADDHNVPCSFSEQLIKNCARLKESTINSSDLPLRC